MVDTKLKRLGDGVWISWKKRVAKIKEYLKKSLNCNNIKIKTIYKNKTFIKIQS